MQNNIKLIKRKIIKKFELVFSLKMLKIFKKSSKNCFSLFHRHIILFASIFLLYAFTNINFKQKLKSIENYSTQRKLFSGFEKQKTEDICQKADKDLILLYESDSYFYIKENTPLKKSTSYLLNYVEDKEDSELKAYIFSFYAQIILAALDILLILIWILLCIFISKDYYLDCLLKARCVNKCLKNIFFIISISIYLVVIVLNIILLFNIHIFLQDINNSFCSLFKISYHTYNGEEYFYEMKPKWAGINQIKNLIQKTKENLNKLTNQNNQINKKINEIKENKYFNPDNISFVEKHINEFCDLQKNKVPNPDPFNDNEISEFLYCSDILYSTEKGYNETINSSLAEINDIYNILISIDNNMNKIEFSLEYAKNKLDSFVKIIKDMELEYFNDLAHLFETVIRKYFIYITYVFFILVLLLELGGLINMIVLRSCFSIYCNKIYNFIWNFQFFSVILIFLIAIFFASIKIFVNDISSIMQSYYNNDKEKENRTFYNTQYDLEGMNKCIIGDGDLAQYLNLDKDAEPLIHFYSMINIIKNNLNYYKNYEIILEKNETNITFNELEQNPFLAQYKLQGNSNLTNAEEELEKNLNLYTNNRKYQILGYNSYYAKYFFVYDKKFCKHYTHLIELNDNNVFNYYEIGDNCMILKDFPSDKNYFKSIGIKNHQLSDLNELVTEYKKRYYDDGGFEPSFLKLLQNSKIYINNTINKESNGLKKDIINIYEILENKINIIHDLYKNILKQNSTDLFSAFNCGYLKRDFFIFLDQLDNNLSHSLKNVSIFCFILAFFSFLSILLSVLSIKLTKVERKYNEKLFNVKEKSEKHEISEKPKIRNLHEKFNFDEGAKSSTNEKSGLKKRRKSKHVIDIKLDNNIDNIDNNDNNEKNQ